MINNIKLNRVGRVQHILPHRFGLPEIAFGFFSRSCVVSARGPIQRT